VAKVKKGGWKRGGNSKAIEQKSNKSQKTIKQNSNNFQISKIKKLRSCGGWDLFFGTYL
jgi:hypothetical protein